MRKTTLLYSTVFYFIFYSGVVVACFDYNHSRSQYGNIVYTKTYMQLRTELFSKYRELDRLYENGLSNADEEIKAIIADIDVLIKRLQNYQEPNGEYC
ncbi:hypothetical protein DCF83_14885 [Edwardsiella tarda]|uniref:hypothetical protein n=1 Tax=Edwardsiella tarda TaxID=636 RepID=UPI0011B1F3B3|nr:hypothetical protein [Edwardsiella tarda]UCQ27277.1 hypothetical protein DCF83_14885 [Edwardsiella tarda]